MRIALGIVILLALQALSMPAQAAATCFCKVSKDVLWNKTSATGVLLDLTGEVNKSFTGAYQQHEDNQKSCKNTCAKLIADKYTKNLGIAQATCAAGAANLTEIKAWSAVGTKAYREAAVVGVIVNQAPVTTTICRCPNGWFTNNTPNSNVNGGVTVVTSGNCKRLAGYMVNVNPLPPNATAMGSWGFTWFDQLWEYGTTANGGAPQCITSVVSPAACGWF